ncbi:IS5 family transposase [Dehalobacter restrictus]|uniref:IS5 family transposase n=1 Tax=Dehalobacter restrictus TaxID=55583 RepID=UPI003D00BEC6
MGQQTFSDIEYSNRRKKTKREEFLEIMNEIIPWDEWVALIQPHYFDGKRGRPPLGIGKMLRMYLLQIWFSLSDEGVEDAIYDSYAMRKFMGIDFIHEQAPDATTLLKFRHLIEGKRLREGILEAINRCLEQCGHIMKGGTIVDATLISAPSSTKNASGSRDPEMHQTKKGNQWYFGMKCHIGVDAGTGYIHGIAATGANVHDIAEASKLMRPEDEVFYGDAGYLGLNKRPEITEDPHKSQIDYRIAERPGKKRSMDNGPARDFYCHIEFREASVRAKVEHAFHIIKNIFGFKKVCYRGIAKNLNRLYMLAASANLLMCARSGGWRSQCA